jgi:hypothetical protein
MGKKVASGKGTVIPSTLNDGYACHPAYTAKLTPVWGFTVYNILYSSVFFFLVGLGRKTGV